MFLRRYILMASSVLPILAGCQEPQPAAAPPPVEVAFARLQPSQYLAMLKICSASFLIDRRRVLEKYGSPSVYSEVTLSDGYLSFRILFKGRGDTLALVNDGYREIHDFEVRIRRHIEGDDVFAIITAVNSRQRKWPANAQRDPGEIPYEEFGDGQLEHLTSFVRALATWLSECSPSPRI